jgi:hypothetical protein
MHEVVSARTDAELNRLFNLYRLANLNTRYYGCRAEIFERRLKWVQVVIALLSAAALSILLASDTSGTRLAGAVMAGIAAVVSSIVPFLGWADKAREMRNLNFAYGQIFSQVEFVITDIRRAGEMTDEQLGLARMVHEAYMRIDAIDELEPDRELIEKLDAHVREAFPNDYMWTNM